MGNEKQPHEISLETICKELRKKVTTEREGMYLDELIKRVDTAYLEMLDKIVPQPVSNDLPWGWKRIEDLCHVRPYSTVLFWFPYPDPSQFTENTNLPLNFCNYEANGGYVVVAVKSFDNKYYAGGDGRRFTDELNVVLDTSKATRFALFANSHSVVIRESLMLSNMQLRREVTRLKECLERKNLELDALGYVWCYGGCVGGQFQEAEPQEITEEMLEAAVHVVTRLVARGSNSKDLMRKTEWHRSRLEAYLAKRKKHGLEQAAETAKSLLTRARECAASAIAEFTQEDKEK